eukprot:scaffold21.g2113.t1
MWGFYVTSMAGVALSVTYMIRKYAAPKVSPLVLVITSLAWLTALSVVALVPIDVYSTLAQRRTGPLEVFWNISYWCVGVELGRRPENGVCARIAVPELARSRPRLRGTDAAGTELCSRPAVGPSSPRAQCRSTQVLTWAVIPVLQGYAISGAFSVLGRIGTSLRRLWLFYLIIGALSVLGVLIALAAGQLQLSTLPKLIVTLSNTYGLIVIIALLGYGLVELPRILWRRSFPERRLKWHYHRVGRAADKLTDASAELEKALAIVLATSQQIPRSDTHLRGYMDRVIKFTDEFSPVRLETLARSKIDFERLEEADLDYAGGVPQLASLRARVKMAVTQFVGYRGEYVNFVKKALDLEAVCKSRQHGVYTPPSGATSRWAVWAYTYTCVGRPWVLRLAAVAAAAVSAVVVWSEATIGSGRSPDLSPFSLAIHSGVAQDEFLIQLLVAAPLVYLCACAYFSLFKLGNFGFYHLVSGATWAYSLLLSGSLLARFAPALCFNFLHVIRMNGESMVFIQRMGSMNDVPVLGADFNNWFPLTLLVYVVLLTLNWFDTERADDEHTSRGMRLVQMEATAVGRGYPIGEGIGLFGCSTSLSASAGVGGRGKTLPTSSSKQQLDGAGSAVSMELNSAASFMRGRSRPGGGDGGSSLHTPLFGGAGSSSSSLPAAAEAAPPSQAALVRQKYVGGRVGAGSAAADAPGGSDVDNLFAGVQGRQSRMPVEAPQQAQPPTTSFSLPWRRGN